MATEKLKALVNTVIKQSTVDSSQITDQTQKFSLAAGSEIEINDSKFAANNHWELELTSSVNGVTKWFAYIPHVEIRENDRVEEVLQDIKNSEFNVYHQPTEQDWDGKGIPPNGGNNRSEKICPVYVLSPRRQTDSLVRQLITVLPIKDTAFIIAERLVQYPEDYLPTISQFEKAVLVQSFVGIGKSSSSELVPRHEKELWRIEQSIRLLQSMKREISAVVCAMGDSMSPVAKEVRQKIQARLYSLLDQYNLSAIKQPITWGADELVAMAIAQTLPKTKVRIKIANDDTNLHYDANRRPSEVVREKLPAVGLEKSETDWDFEIAILTRRPFGSTDDYQKDDQKQAQLDDEFLAQYKNYSPEQRSKLVIIDGRLFNGAWNARSVLPHSDLLAFGSWGTFGNCVGSTLAVAKILFHAKNPAAQKQLYLEAVAHDVFANGYKEAQRKEEPESFCNKLKNKTGITFNHYDGYPDSAITQKVFALLNQHVNQRMQQHFAGTSCIQGRVFRITPQFWRTFESEVHIWPRLPEEVHKVGIYRTDLDALAFNPSSSGQLA
jgi:hypothetical protein